MKPSFLLFILFVMAAIGFVYYILTARQFNGDEPALLINGRKIGVELADTMEKKLKGLSGRKNLPENKGMLFVFSEPQIQTFWMKDMNFPIDIIWLRENVVIGFVENAPPPIEGQELKIYSSPEKADKVLEINAGLVKKWNIKTGDRVESLSALF